MSSSSRGGSPRRIALVVAAVVVALDAASKALAVHFLAWHGDVGVLGGLVHLELYRNHAGPHDMLEGHPVLVSAMAAAGVAAIALLTTRVRTRAGALAAGLLLGGGAGNLLDRLLRAPGPLRGGVVDWLRPPWSTGSMNLADLSIAAALAVVLLSAARAPGRRLLPLRAATQEPDRAPPS